MSIAANLSTPDPTADAAPGKPPARARNAGPFVASAELEETLGQLRAFRPQIEAADRELEGLWDKRLMVVHRAFDLGIPVDSIARATGVGASRVRQWKSLWKSRG